MGSVVELRNRQEAEKATIGFRSSINADVGTPRCVCGPAAHYRLHELTVEKKAFSTIEGHRKNNAICRCLTDSFRSFSPRKTIR